MMSKHSFILLAENEYSTMAPMGLLIMATVKAQKPEVTAGNTLEAKAMNLMLVKPHQTQVLPYELPVMREALLILTNPGELCFLFLHAHINGNRNIHAPPHGALQF